MIQVRTKKDNIVIIINDETHIIRYSVKKPFENKVNIDTRFVYALHEEVGMIIDGKAWEDGHPAPDVVQFSVNNDKAKVLVHCFETKGNVNGNYLWSIYTEYNIESQLNPDQSHIFGVYRTYSYPDIKTIRDDDVKIEIVGSIV